MNSDERNQAVPTNGAGSVAKRPGCVTAYALLFFLAAILGLLSPLLNGAGPAGSALSEQDLMVRSVRSVAQAVVSLVLGVGLWRLRKWAVGLALAWTLYTFGTALYGTIATWTGSLASAWYPIVSGLFTLTVITWFVKNRELFRPSPGLDRWLVVAGILVLVALFVTNIVWV
jgi:hypothetical protein